MHIADIYTYPIKSLRGVSMPSLMATTTGFQYDRNFMLWNVKRDCPMHIGHISAMCLFSTSLTPLPVPDTIEVTYGLDHMFGHPETKIDGSVLTVPLCPAVEKLKPFRVNMHLSPCTAYEMGDVFHNWFSVRFGFEVKLLYIGNSRRKVLGNLPPPQKAVEGDHWILFAVSLVTLLVVTSICLLMPSPNSWYSILVMSMLGPCGFMLLPTRVSNMKQTVDANVSITFADLAPYLVVSRRSWQNVQDRLPEGEVVDITKFRPNIVVEGADEAFEEDFWAELEIGGLTKVLLTQNCARCASLNVDYSTGKPGLGQAGKILKLLSSDRRVDPGTKWSPVFGRYGFLAPLQSKKVSDNPGVYIAAGQEVRVRRRNEQRTIIDYPKAA